MNKYIQYVINTVSTLDIEVAGETGIGKVVSLSYNKCYYYLVFNTLKNTLTTISE